MEPANETRAVVKVGGVAAIGATQVPDTKSRPLANGPPSVIVQGMRHIELVETLMDRQRWLFLFALSVATLVHAQTGGMPRAITPSIPTDSKELVIAASQSNDLLGSNLQPWHLKASCKVLDPNGKVTDEGTIEEFWAAHDKRRVTYTAKNFNQTTYWDGDRVLQAGSAEPPDASPYPLFSELHGALIEPMPPAKFLSTQNFSEKDQNFGAIKLACMTAKIQPLSKTDNFGKSLGPTYCLNTDKPVLRVIVSGLGFGQVLRNKVYTFQGIYVPQELHLVQQGKTISTLQVDLLETIKSIDDSEFAPTSDAKLLPQPMSIVSGAAHIMLVAEAYPHYPIAAKESRTSGTVVIAALIGKDGKLSNLQVESGPVQLREAALDAVKQWEYWPYFDQGEAIEVTTKINVVFNFGN